MILSGHAQPVRCVGFLGKLEQSGQWLRRRRSKILGFGDAEGSSLTAGTTKTASSLLPYLAMGSGFSLAAAT